MILGGGKEIMGSKVLQLKNASEGGVRRHSEGAVSLSPEKLSLCLTVSTARWFTLRYSSTFLPDRSIVFGLREITMWSSTPLSRS